jgi:hypothetical protein
MLYRMFVALVRSQFVLVNACYAALICLYFGLNYISAFCWLNAIVPGKIRMFALWHLLIPMFSVKVYHMTHIASFLKAKVQNVAASSSTQKGPTSLTINYHQYPSITVNHIPYYTIDYLYYWWPIDYLLITNQLYHYTIPLYHIIPLITNRFFYGDINLAQPDPAESCTPQRQPPIRRAPPSARVWAAHHFWMGCWISLAILVRWEDPSEGHRNLRMMLGL